MPPLPSPGTRRNADRSVTFTVWAPFASVVELVIEADGHQTRHAMNVVLDEPSYRYFAITRPDLPAGTRYGYALDGGPVRPDPMTRHQPEGVHRLSALHFSEDIIWQHDFAGVPRDEVVIYELHIGAFTAGGTFDAAISRLADLADLGITAIEIMPVSQFPGRRGWGYDGVHPFAVQNSYGGPDAMARFIDAAHGHGLAVLLDVVYNHFGPEGNYLGCFGPYLTDRYSTPWGDALNFDGPGADAVRAFICDNVRHWIGDFRLDGLRLDAIQTIIDVSARHILTDIADAAHDAAGDRTVHVFGETDQNDIRLVTPVDKFGVGLDGIWADDFHHAVHALITGESDMYYADFQPPASTPAAAIADVSERIFSRDGRRSIFRGHSFGRPAAAADPSQFVACIQNHDQVGNRAFGERLPELADPAAIRLAAALLLLSPQTPLLFMGEEYGETNRFPFFCDFEDPALNQAVRDGRAREYWPGDVQWTDDMPDPPRRSTFEQAILSWDWSQPPHGQMRTLYRDLLAIRRTLIGTPQSVIQTGDVLVLQRGKITMHANLTAATQSLAAPVDATLSTAGVQYGGYRDTFDTIQELDGWEAVIEPS